MKTRLLLLDDSGKPDAAHSSRAVVIAGFSIDADQYPSFSRRVLGAKARFFASRGVPQAWEIKSSAVIKPNAWKRSKNRKFCNELVRLLGVAGGTCFSVGINKKQMKHPMSLKTTMPLQLQALVGHFDAECRSLGRMGMIIADWSSHQHDQHASRCVASFAASRGLTIHPSVYYASSYANEGIQAADLIAGVRRRSLEGDAALAQLDQTLSAMMGMSKPDAAAAVTVDGRSFNNWINLF